MYLESEIKNFSKKIGIDAIGITSAKPFNNVKRIFIDRVRRGFYKDLNYTIEKINFICNPKNMLTDAKSIISIALSYNVPIGEEKIEERENSYEYDIHSEERKTKKRGNTGIIAKFAWGIDYHKVLKNKLKILADFISSKLLNDSNKPAEEVGLTPTSSLQPVEVNDRLRRRLEKRWRAGLAYSFLFALERYTRYLLTELSVLGERAFHTRRRHP